jgi:hypothetical protein
MKKLLFGLIALVSVVCLYACSNDEESNNNTTSGSIVGSWETSEKKDGYTVTALLKFGEDGSYYENFGYIYNGQVVDQEIERGTYTCTSKEVTVRYDYGEEYTFRYTIKGDKLSLIDDAYNYTLTLTRKK